MPRYPCVILAVLILSCSFCTSHPIAQQQSNLPPPVLRQKTQLVTININVTYDDQHSVSGLTKNDFLVFEDKVKQQIEYFAQVDVPLSIGIVLDVSSSISSKLHRAKEMLTAFIDSSHSEDEFFLLTFNQSVSQQTNLTNSETILARLPSLKAHGNTSLYDAVYQGMEKLREARHPKKVLLVITDGEDNSSQYNLNDIIKRAKESDVIIYCLSLTAVHGGNCGLLCQMTARRVLSDISNVTGGQAFFPLSFEEVESNIVQIALELRQQYSIGYVSSNPVTDRKWRRISVRLEKDVIKRSQNQRVIIRTREGYYAVP